MLHVFVGPTLPAADPELTRLDRKIKPPVRHGDLFAGDIIPGDTVVILDGLYHQSAALRHKEIIHAIRSGIRVWGAASIGAVRAAELKDFGMIGVGAVYRWYVSGQIVADDEVSVAHAADTDGLSQNIPLVNLRVVLRRARGLRILDQAASDALWEAFRSIYYPLRSVQAICAAAAVDGQREFADWYATNLASDENFCNQKRIDALAAVRAAGCPVGAQAGRGDGSGGRHWRTVYFRRWQNSFSVEEVDGHRLRSLDRLWFQQIFNPDFRARWHAFLEHYSLNPADNSPGRPLGARIADLYADGYGGDPNPPTYRVFRPTVDVFVPGHRDVLLSRETEDDRATLRSYIDEYDDFKRRNPLFSPDWLKRDIAEKLLLELWSIGEPALDDECRGRGFHSVEQAIKAFTRFAIGYVRQVAARRDEPAGKARQPSAG